MAVLGFTTSHSQRVLVAPCHQGSTHKQGQPGGLPAEPLTPVHPWSQQGG